MNLSLEEPLDVPNQLWLSATGTATRLGYSFSPSCAEMLRLFIGAGAARLVNEHSAADHEHIGAAKAAVATLVSTMAQLTSPEQESLPEPDRVRTLEEDSFTSARLQFCPCYPFC